MAIDDILQRHAHRDVVPEHSEKDDVEDLGGFGRLRGIRDRALSLELRKKDDTVLAIPYTLIEQFLFSPADGITLRAGGRDIKIRGRNLNTVSSGHLTLLSALARHRVSWIGEQSRTRKPSADGSVTIDSIDW